MVVANINKRIDFGVLILYLANSLNFIFHFNSFSIDFFEVFQVENKN